MSKTNGFVCEPTFTGNAELATLVDLWGTFFDYRDKIGLSDVGDSETFREATEIIQDHSRYVLQGDLEAQDDIIDSSRLWTVRAMLACKDIRLQAQAINPRDFSL